MLIAGLELAPATRAVWYAAGIRDTDHLRRPAVELLALPGITGSILYETVCQLNEHQLGLPAYADASRIMAPTTNDLEMLRLRIVEGASLRDTATTFGVSRERVRQILYRHFGMSGEPPAATERRQARFTTRAKVERIIAVRLCQHEQGMTIAQLFNGLAPEPPDAEAQAAVERMKAKGFLTVDGERVMPTATLRHMTRDRAANRSPGARRGTEPESVHDTAKRESRPGARVVADSN